jgi:hypothetical protein
MQNCHVLVSGCDLVNEVNKMLAAKIAAEPGACHPL